MKQSIKKISISILVSTLILPTLLHAASYSGSDKKIIESQGMLANRWSLLEANVYACEHHLSIAIEGGGTNTRVRIATKALDASTDVDILYAHELNQGSNLNQIPKKAAGIVRGLINTGIDTVASEHKWNKTTVCYDLGLGMAGTEGNNNTFFLRELQKDQRLQRAVLASDAEVAWLSVFDYEGVIIISGTGNVILARNSAGDTDRIGGFGTPMSDRPSGASFCLDYGRCIHKEVHFRNNKATWREDIKLTYLEKLINEFDGPASKLLLHLNEQARLNPPGLASMGEEIMNHAEPEVAGMKTWQMEHCVCVSPDHDECSTHPIKDGLTNKDYCATYALEESAQDLYRAITNMSRGFEGLPFAIHGTFGKVLWEKMYDIPGMDMTIEARKVSRPVDPMTGSLKLLDL